MRSEFRWAWHRLLIFVCVAFAFWLPLASAEERNCPAHIVIKSIQGDGSAAFSPAMEDTFKQVITAKLGKHATVMSHNELVHILAKDTKRMQQDPNCQRNSPNWQLCKPSPEAETAMAQNDADFIITSNMQKLNTLVVFNFRAINARGGQVIASDMRKYPLNQLMDDGNTFSADLAQVAAKFADQMNVRFYCVKLNPEAAHIDFNKPEDRVRKFTSEVEDLMGHKISGEQIWMRNQQTFGASTTPQQVGLNNGKAEATYKVTKKMDWDSFHASIQPKANGSIKTEKIARIEIDEKMPDCYLLKFSGQSQVKVSIAGDRMRGNNTSFNRGEIPFCVSDMVTNPNDYQALGQALAPLGAMAQNQLNWMQANMPGASSIVNQVKANSAPDMEPYRSIWGEGKYRSTLTDFDMGMDGQAGPDEMSYVSKIEADTGRTAEGSMQIRGKVVNGTVYFDFTGSAAFENVARFSDTLSSSAFRIDRNAEGMGFGTGIQFLAKMPLHDGATAQVSFTPSLHKDAVYSGQVYRYTLHLTLLDPKDPRHEAARQKKNPADEIAKALKNLPTGAGNPGNHPTPPDSPDAPESPDSDTDNSDTGTSEQGLNAPPPQQPFNPTWSSAPRYTEPEQEPVYDAPEEHSSQTEDPSSEQPDVLETIIDKAREYLPSILGN